VDACPEAALENGEGGMPKWIEDRCNGCGECVQACPQDVVLVTGPRIPFDGHEQAVEKALAGGCSKSSSCKAGKIPRNEAYFPYVE
jgi:Fe-S-cluster-containing hydrogenase component 2